MYRKRKDKLSIIYKLSWIIPIAIIIIGFNTIAEMVRMGYGMFDIFLFAVFIWAIDIVTPPYPSSELPFLLLGRRFKLKLWMSELLSQAFAGVVIFLAYLRFDDLIAPMISAGFRFINTLPGIILTSIFAMIFIYFAIEEK